MIDLRFRCNYSACDKYKEVVGLPHRHIIFNNVLTNPKQVFDDRVTTEFLIDGKWVEWKDLIMANKQVDMVNSPPHYTGHPSGVECIEIAEHLGFNLGNAFKYVWRRNEKGNKLENLKKALWYIERACYSGNSLSPLPSMVYFKLGKVVSSDDEIMGNIMTGIVFGYNNPEYLCKAKELLEKEVEGLIHVE